MGNSHGQQGEAETKSSTNAPAPDGHAHAPSTRVSSSQKRRKCRHGMPLRRCAADLLRRQSWKCSYRNVPGGCHVQDEQFGEHWVAVPRSVQQQDAAVMCTCTVCDDCLKIPVSAFQESQHSRRSSNSPTASRESLPCSASTSAAMQSVATVDHGGGGWQRVCAASLPQANVATRCHYAQDPAIWERLLRMQCLFQEFSTKGATARESSSVLKLSLLPSASLPKMSAVRKTVGSANAKRAEHTVRHDDLSMPLPRISGDTCVLTTADLEVVVAFLQLGNLTAANGEVRRYTDAELASPRIGMSLSECRACITRYVQACLCILLCEKPANFVAPKNRSLNAGGSVADGNPWRGRESATHGTSDLDHSAVASDGAEKVDGGIEAVLDCRTSLVDGPIVSPSRRAHPFLSAADEDLILRSLKALIGNRTWNIHGCNRDVYAFLRSQAHVKLEEIAKRGESSLYKRVCGEFSHVKLPPKRSKKPRMDRKGIIPFKHALKKPLSATLGGMQPHDSEFLVILEYLARLFDPFFQGAAKELAATHNGQWHAAPPKTCVRMAAKLHRDHVNEPEPKAAANLDTARAALIFEEPKNLVECFHACSSRGLHCVRAKNNFRRSFNALTESYGYRSLLANFRQELPLTWGDLIDADASGFLPRFLGVGELVVVDKENLWFGRRKGTVRGFDASGQNVLLSYDHLADDRHADDKRGPPSLPVAELVEYNAAARTAALQDWKVPDSLRHLPRLIELVTRLQFSLFNNARLRATPVVFIVEVQFLLTEYLLMRRESHMWYKIMRTPSASDLVADFYSYAGVRRETSFLLDALRDDNQKVVQYFVNFPRWTTSADSGNLSVNIARSLEVDDRDLEKVIQIIGPQVRHCRDPTSGHTPLHFVVLREDGLFDGLLSRILLVIGDAVNSLDVAGNSAHALCTTLIQNRDGEKLARAKMARAAIEAHPQFDSAWDALPALFRATGGFGHDIANTSSATDVLWSRIPRNASSSGWRDRTGWCTDTPLSQWRGVLLAPGTSLASTRSQRLCVVELELNRNGLRGRLPSELGLLHELQQLRLNSNQLTGPIPSELGHLRNLTKLSLRDNCLGGKIPTELCTLPKLRDLWLFGNQLTGPLPPELGRLPKIEVLGLNDNCFTGNLPSELNSLTSLQMLYLEDNNFSALAEEGDVLRKALPRCAISLFRRSVPAPE